MSDSGSDSFSVGLSGASAEIRTRFEEVDVLSASRGRL